MNEEEKNIDIREKLLKLPKIKASEGFETELLRKINQLDAEESASKQKENSKRSTGFLSSIFTKKRAAWLIPSLSLGIIAIIAVTIIISNNSNKDLIRQETISESVTDSGDKMKSPDLSLPPIAQEEKMPGDEVKNDLDIGKSDGTSRREVSKGFTDQDEKGAPVRGMEKESPKIELESKAPDVKANTEKETGKEMKKIESQDIKKTESKPEKKSDDVMKKEEVKGESPREKAVMPPSNTLIEEKKDKNKEEKSDKEKVDKKKLKGIKEIGVEVLEEIKKKVTDKK